MVEHKCILSEKPDALDGALEWLQAEIKKLETENDKKKKVTESLKADIRPLVQKVAKKRGLVQPLIYGMGRRETSFLSPP